MAVPAPFPEAVVSVYRGWHRLAEKKVGWERAKWVLINDLSRSAVDPLSFSDFTEVRTALERLLDVAPDRKSAVRIEQSLFFLGQDAEAPVTKEAVLKRGIPWRPVEDSALNHLSVQFEGLKREVVEAGQMTKDAVLGRYNRGSGEAGVVNEIRALGEASLEIFYQKFPSLTRAKFETSEIESTLPWSNMATHEDGGLRLIANRGELADLGAWRRGFLALHEIGGHVLHFSQLLDNVPLQRKAPHLLCLAIHTYDAYFIEGIAQFLTSVYVNRLSPALSPLHMDVKRSELWFAVRHRNLTKLIEGEIDAGEAAEVEKAYLGGDAKKLHKIYDAILKDIFLCCQTLVFYPSHQALLPALGLQDGAFDRFLATLLREHHAPEELDRLVSRSLA